MRSPAIERQRRQVFTQQMRRTRAFWSLPLIHGLGCAGHGIVLLYAVPLAVERGLTLVAASVILSLIAVCSIGSRLLTPIVAERWGRSEERRVGKECRARGGACHSGDTA